MTTKIPTKTDFLIVKYAQKKLIKSIDLQILALKHYSF